MSEDRLRVSKRVFPGAFGLVLITCVATCCSLKRPTGSLGMGGEGPAVDASVPKATRSAMDAQAPGRLDSRATRRSIEAVLKEGRSRLADLLGTDTVRTDDAVDVREFGARGDGVTDDTDAIAAALATRRTVVFSRTDAFYSVSRPLQIRNSVIGIGRPRVRMNASDGSEKTRVFEVRGYSGPGLSISGMHLDGNWDGESNEGEWSHLIAVLGSSRVRIEDNLLENAYGDNVYVGVDGTIPSANVVIARNTMRKPYRCNVAVVAATGVRILDNTMSKDNSYVSAIDLEPNPTPGHVVQDMVIVGNRFTAHQAPWLLLYSQPPSTGFTEMSRRVHVEGNIGQAKVLLDKPGHSGSWEDVTLVRNVYLGHEGSSPEARLFRLSHKVGNGALFRRVRIEGNLDLAGMHRGGPTFGAWASNIEGLVIENNVFLGARTTGLHVNGCPGAVLRGNTVRGTTSASLILEDLQGVDFSRATIEGNVFDKGIQVEAIISNATIHDNQTR